MDLRMHSTEEGTLMASYFSNMYPTRALYHVEEIRLGDINGVVRAESTPFYSRGCAWNGAALGRNLGVSQVGSEPS